MDTLNQLVHRSKCLADKVKEFKNMEYPDSCPDYYNLQRRSLIMLADQCHDLAKDLPKKE